MEDHQSCGRNISSKVLLGIGRLNKSLDALNAAASIPMMVALEKVIIVDDRIYVAIVDYPDVLASG